MDFADISKKYAESIADAAPIQKTIGLLIFTFLVQTYRSCLGNFSDEILHYKFYDIFLGKDPITTKIDLFSIGVGLILTSATSILHKLLQKKLFITFSKITSSTQKYKNIIDAINNQTIPAERYRELRSELKSRREKISGKLWAGDIMFYITSASFVLGFFDPKIFIFFGFGTLSIIAWEKARFDIFASECLPIILILKEKFGAKGTNYPF